MEVRSLEKQFCIGSKRCLFPDYSMVDAVQLPSGLIVMEMVVTPEFAKECLDNCSDPNNRKIKDQRVNMYVSDIESGNWDLLTTDNAITFDVTGKLRNGHHRLHAIVKSGVPVKMIIFLDASKNIKIFDKGGGRTTADTLRMQGMDKNLLGNNQIALVKYLFSSVLSRVSTISDSVVKSYLINHSAEVLEAVRISKIGGGEGYCRNAQMCAVLYCAIRQGTSSDALEKFCTVANKGVADREGFTSALYFSKFVQETRNIRTRANGSERAIRNGIQLVGERALLDYLNGNSRSRRYDPTKIEPGALIKYVKEQDKNEVNSLLGKR